MSGPARPLPPPRSRTSPTLALACLAASLLVVDAVFWLWPDPDLAADLVPEAPPPREQLALEMVEVTVQPPPSALPPAPPPPPDVPDAAPVEVPDDVVVDEIVRDLPLPAPPRPAPVPASPRAPLPGPPGPPSPPPPSPSAPRVVEAPDRSPRLVRASLPVYPPAAQRAGVRARAAVRVLISEGGQVLEARVTERVLLDGRGGETVVAELPYGLEQAALEAARRHQFRPARDGGDRVRAYALLSLSFDPPR